MEDIRYCTVRPKGMSSVYLYLADEGIGIGSFVEIPLGSEGELWDGEVLMVGSCPAEDAPPFLDRLKRVARKISKEEHGGDHEGDVISTGDEWAQLLPRTEEDELEEVDDLIKEESFDEVFRWARAHRGDLGRPAIMEKVRQCYELCVEQNDPAAALELGAMCYAGQGVPQDFKKAVCLYELAALAGGTVGCRALCNLGYCWYYGRHQECDYEKAHRYFSLCALLYDDPNALYKLGDMYKNGFAVEKDEGRAFTLWDRAFGALDREGEDPGCKADVELRIGESYLKGYVVERNVSLAHAMLAHALIGFYERRKEDPFVGSLIERTKALIQEAQRALDEELIDGH